MAKRLRAASFAGSLVTMALLALPVDVDDSDTLKNVPFGFPFPALYQNHWTSTPRNLPQTRRLQSPLEHPTRLDGRNMLLNWASCTLVSLFAGALWARRTTRRN